MPTPYAVADVMTRDVICVQPHTTCKHIALLLARYGISAVPVVDETHRVLGVVSEADLVSKQSQRATSRLAPGHRRRRTKANARQASELMTTPPVTIGEDVAIPEAARLLQRSGRKRLVVVDRQGQLAGIASRRDLLEVFARSDHDIAADVRDEALVSMLGTDASAVSADVTNGVVVLTGRVSRRSMISVAVALALRVEGVVDVIEHLTWTTDDTDSPLRWLAGSRALHRLLPRPR
jgi:CBS domain-containing protein